MPKMGPVRVQSPRWHAGDASSITRMTSSATDACACVRVSVSVSERILEADNETARKQGYSCRRTKRGRRSPPSRHWARQSGQTCRWRVARADTTRAAVLRVLLGRASPWMPSASQRMRATSCVTEGGWEQQARCHAKWARQRLEACWWSWEWGVWARQRWFGFVCWCARVPAFRRQPSPTHSLLAPALAAI